MKEKILAAIGTVLIVLFLMLLTASCTKTTSPNPNPNPPGGGGGGGGGNGSLSVKSISPTNPYPDDEFTIIGTGFNTNKNLDTVEFGRLVNGNFGAWHGGLASEYPSLCTVISATATELRVKAANPVSLDASSFSIYPYSTSISVARITVGGKKVVSPVITFKRIMMLNSIDDPEAHISYGRPSDSLVILGRGFNKSGLSVKIGGVILQDIKIDSQPYQSMVTLRLPKSFFGVDALDEYETFEKTVSVKNNDGKTLSKEFTFYKSPKMVISSMYTSQTSYSKGNGAAVKVFIYGRNFKPDAVFTLTSNTGYQAVWNMPVTNYQDSLKFELGTGALPIGNYTLNLDRGTFWIGRATFSVTN